MKKKHAIGLLGGATGIAAASAALLSMSAMANGLEAPALDLTLPAHHSASRILLAQADDASSAAPSSGESSAEAAAPPEEPAAEEPAAEEPAMTRATYTSEQADNGEKSYEKYCVDCHGSDLRGGLIGGPPLRGLTFESKYMYEGAAAGALFEFMSTAMPPDSPGRYSPKTYVDIMAYILKRNGFQTGAELPSDVDALYNLTIEK